MRSKNSVFNHFIFIFLERKIVVSFRKRLKHSKQLIIRHNRYATAQTKNIYIYICLKKTQINITQVLHLSNQ